MELKINIAPGELIDKITILEIKLARIDDPAKLRNVTHEHAALSEILAAKIVETPQLIELRATLKTLNETLWQAEEDLRLFEHRHEFGPAFIAAARSVYRTNDRRAAVKRQINELLGSQLIEEKSYPRY